MQLTLATLTHMALADLLFQKQFSMAHFPELVDLAVVGTGLGIPVSNISFVEKNILEWDYTQWSHQTRGFLDQRALSYASALSAWVRQDPHPKWARTLRLDIRHPMTKSLRYLVKTGDSFFTRETMGEKLLGQSQEKWLAMANEESLSKQIVAIRHVRPDTRLASQQEQLLLKKLGSRNEFVVLNAMWAIEEMKLTSETVLEELRMLVDHPSNEVRSKSARTLALLRGIDDRTLDRLTNMLGTGVSFVEHSAAYALSSLDAVPDYVLKPMNQGLIRALQMCDYGLIPHFVNAFQRWLDNPESYFEMLLAEDSPELLEVALDTLEQIRQPLTQLQ